MVQILIIVKEWLLNIKLEIPDNFQWIWIAGSFICYLFGKVTMKSSKTWSIQVFAVLVLIFGVLPITYHQVLLVFSNISKLGLVGSLLSMFKDLSLVPLVLHGFQLNYSYILHGAWTIKRKKA